MIPEIASGSYWSALRIITFSLLPIDYALYHIKQDGTIINSKTLGREGREMTDYQRFAAAGTDVRSRREIASFVHTARQTPQPKQRRGSISIFFLAAL